MRPPQQLLYGFRPVFEALRARRRRLARLLLREPLSARTARLPEAAQQAGVPVERLAKAAFEHGLPRELRALPHQGVLLEAGPLPELQPEAFLALPFAAPRCLVALDGVQDPQNVGAVARAAEGAGAAGLVLPTRRAPPLSPAVSRAGAGAIEHLPVLRAPNLGRTLLLLREHGFWCVGAEAGEGFGLFDCPDHVFEGDLVLVLGAEERGISPGLAGKLDHRVQIPMAGRVESLNVAAAAALLLYEWRRRSGGGSGSGGEAGSAVEGA